MDKRERPVRNAITLLSIALLIILFLFILIFYVYYDQIFYSKTSPSKQNSYSTRSYNDKSQNCVNLLVPYTERETYMEKVPAYSLFNAGHYNNDNLNYKVIVNQESMPENSRYITELITIKIENRDNDDGYFDISVVFSPENENKITKHKSKFIREDESEKFEFEYRHDKDQHVGWVYNIDSQSEYKFRSESSPYPYSNIFYKNDYVYDYNNCFHGYCKPTQVLSYREVPRVRMVTKYKTVTQCN